MSFRTFIAASVAALLTASAAYAADPARAFATPNAAAIAAAKVPAGAKGALPPVAAQTSMAGRVVAAPRPATMPGVAAGTTGRPELDLPGGSELQMLNLQSILSQRQHVLTLGTKIISSLECKDCIKNLGK
jgi:hypothetical protein